MPESIKIGPEHLGPLINIPTSREIMRIYSSGAEDRFSAAVRHNLVRYGDRVLSISEVIELEKHAAVNRHRELPALDDLTGVYSRRDFYTFLAICKELGHDAVWVVTCDMNYLKDHNLKLGEPSGGDFALTAVAKTLDNVAEDIGFFTVRYQFGGGDDFLLVGFPPKERDVESQLTINDIGDSIDKELMRIKPGDFLESRIDGKQLVHFSTGEVIKLSPELVGKLKLELDLLKIIVPPSVVWDTVVLDPSEEVKIYSDSNGEYYDFAVLAEKIESAHSRIKGKKLVLYKKIKLENPSGVNKLARRENDA